MVCTSMPPGRASLEDCRDDSRAWQGNTHRTTRRPRANNGHLPPGIGFVLTDSGQHEGDFLVGQKAFDAADGNRGIQSRPAAFVLAGVEADAGADRHERVAFAVQPQASA